MNTLQAVPGQRWISDTEPELGLGTVLEVEGRRLSILFTATGETRRYAVDNAPLTRVRFSAGDRIQSRQDWSLWVESVIEEGGLLTYRGKKGDRETAHLKEQDLSSFIQFNTPQERLFAGQTDPDSWFDLRHLTLNHRRSIDQSPVQGLYGARVELIRHQLYIAHKVARRHRPRVLLADEVGLGKTIEACLILHQQLTTHRARRALLLVPDPLVNQWLVELLRRFNLHFSIFDEDRCQASQASAPGANPFLAEQLVLCGLGLFMAHPERQSQVAAGEWDLLIVDEAHHLQWSEQRASPEYRLVEQLARATPGVLLITATPEQLGREGHFARLRLLDPDRFYDLTAFNDEEADYRPVADAVEVLLHQDRIPEESICHLLETLGEQDSNELVSIMDDPQAEPQSRARARETLINILLDRHGTGRVLFRNTRATVEGFPEREVLPVSLPLPEDYGACLAGTGAAQHDPALRLTPEALHEGSKSWWQIDPRVSWLSATLRGLRPAKVLVICARTRTARDLERALRTGEGQHAALFHEDMSILERDRAAAWFADPEDGAQLLICSEIGSEGRNFQFARHLVLFDLPLNPDLLEQRIGRLDRIGQRHRVRIHIPFLEQSAQAVMFDWYHRGLDALARPSPAALTIFNRLKPALLQALDDRDRDQVGALIDAARRLRREIGQTLQQGRDHLLELSSCRADEADRLVGDIRRLDQDPALQDYMTRVFESYGVELEERPPKAYVLRPGTHMLTDHFPGLPAEGLTLTYDRRTALIHEDWQFLTWEHPMVAASMEMTLNGERGNSALTKLSHPLLQAGRLLLECMFVLESVAPRALQAGRFLPPTLIRVLVDEEFRDLGPRLPHSEIAHLCQPVDRHRALQILGQRRQSLRDLLDHGRHLAEEKTVGLLKDARERMMRSYTAEIQRLLALQKVNPNVRDEEIRGIRQQGLSLDGHLKSTQLRLDALRVIIAV